MDLMKKVFIFIVVGILAILCAYFFLAAPQKARTSGTWFQPPMVSDWPSAVFYTYFMTEGLPFSFVYIFIYAAVLAIIVFFFWKAFRLLSKGKEMADNELAIIFMGLTSVFPLGGLVAAPLLGGDGFAHLYHHRFFIPITWMFAAMTFVLFFDWLRDKNWIMREKKWLSTLFIAIVVAVLAFFIWQYSVYAHHELENVMLHTPCTNDPLYIGHESPFSALPYQVWGRQFGCNWLNFVSTKQTPEMLNGGGGDAVWPGMIFYNKTLPENMTGYYYVYAEGTVPVDGNHTVIWQEDGVELWYVKRQPHLPGQKMVSWYDNSTDYQYTRVRWENI